jgi:hypothetical protein
VYSGCGRTGDRHRWGVVAGTLATAIDFISSKKVNGLPTSIANTDAIFVNTSTFLRATKQATVTSEIPDDISKEELHTFLATRYDKVIRSSPLVQDVKVVETAQSIHPDLEMAERLYQDIIIPGEWVTYHIQEKIQYYGVIEFICV